MAYKVLNWSGATRAGVCDAERGMYKHYTRSTENFDAENLPQPYNLCA